MFWVRFRGSNELWLCTKVLIEIIEYIELVYHEKPGMYPHENDYDL